MLLSLSVPQAGPAALAVPQPPPPPWQDRAHSLFIFILTKILPSRGLNQAPLVPQAPLQP